VLLGGQSLRLLGIDPHHQAALAAHAHRHVAAYQESQAAEHLLLREPGLRGDQLADAVGEVLVVCHRQMIADARSGYGFG
jgi:hypothetical protein